MVGAVSTDGVVVGVGPADGLVVVSAEGVVVVVLSVDGAVVVVVVLAGDVVVVVLFVDGAVVGVTAGEDEVAFGGPEAAATVLTVTPVRKAPVAMRRTANERRAARRRT